MVRIRNNVGAREVSRPNQYPYANVGVVLVVNVSGDVGPTALWTFDTAIDTIVNPSDCSALQIYIGGNWYSATSVSTHVLPTDLDVTFPVANTSIATLWRVLNETLSVLFVGGITVAYPQTGSMA